MYFFIKNKIEANRKKDQTDPLWGRYTEKDSSGNISTEKLYHKTNDGISDQIYTEYSTGFSDLSRIIHQYQKEYKIDCGFD